MTEITLTTPFGIICSFLLYRSQLNIALFQTTACCLNQAVLLVQVNQSSIFLLSLHTISCCDSLVSNSLQNILNSTYLALGIFLWFPLNHPKLDSPFSSSFVAWLSWSVLQFLVWSVLCKYQYWTMDFEKWSNKEF